jgi:hypothetical protein
MVASVGRTAESLAFQVGKWAEWSGRGQWRPLPKLDDGVLDRVVADGLAHPQAAVREATVKLMGQSEDPRFAGMLGERVRDEQEEETVRRSGVTALMRLPRDAALPELNASAGIADGRVRSDLAVALGDDMTSDAKRAMVRAFEEEYERHRAPQSRASAGP